MGALSRYAERFGSYIAVVGNEIDSSLAGLLDGERKTHKSMGSSDDEYTIDGQYQVVPVVPVVY